MKLYETQKQLDDVTLYYDDLQLDFTDKSNKFNVLEIEHNQLFLNIQNLEAENIDLNEKASN